MIQGKALMTGTPANCRLFATTVPFVGIKLDGIISDFSPVAGRLGVPGWPAKLDVECMVASHKPKALQSSAGPATSGGRDRDRTCDRLLVRQELYR